MYHEEWIYEVMQILNQSVCVSSYYTSYLLKMNV